MQNIKTTIKKIKYYYKKFILFFENRFGVHEGAVLALLLMLVFVTIGAVAGRPPRKRNLTTTPLLWAKLDGALTDENSTGSTFAYSPGKPSTEMGVSIKEGDNIQYSPGNAIDAGSSVYENWNPNQGTMNVWVQPNWAGNDNTRHDIWNADYGRIDTADANLQAYFKFDEGSEDFAFDSSSNSNIGYLHGPALSFDGGDYVNCGAGASLDVTTNDFSVEFWIKSSSRVSTAITKGSGLTANKGFDVGFDASRKRYCDLNDGTYAGYNNIGSALNLNQWYHITYVFNRSSNLISYVNGAADGTANISARNASLTNSENFIIGAYYNGSYSNFISGQIQNVRIYNRALSETEVGQHYVGNYADESGLVGYWPMDENQGQTVYDKSGSNNNGTRGADANSGADDPTWVNYAPGWTDEGRFGKGVVFDGTDDEVEINDINF